MKIELHQVLAMTEGLVDLHMDEGMEQINPYTRFLLENSTLTCFQGTNVRVGLPQPPQLKGFGRTLTQYTHFLLDV